MDKDFEKQFKKLVHDKVNDFFKDIPHYVIEIGVWAGDEKDDRTEYETVTNKNGKKTKKQVAQPSGLNNAELLYIMEHGSFVNHIPSRQVLHKTIEYAKKNLLQKTVIEGLKQYYITKDIKSFENEIDKMCVRMENYAKVGIRRKTFVNEKDFPPNKPSTIKAKGSDIPLLDTGQLANSIRCKFRKI